MVEGGLGPYVGKTPGIYRCPADHVVADVQRKAGWSGRVRSYSMNSMIGDAGLYSQAGWNVNNPDYTQFFRLTAIPQPSDIFVILDEHPDSIDDGFFVEKAYNDAWWDLPASYHGGAGCFSFVDGHSETHRWLSPVTTPPPVPGAAGKPRYIPTNDQAAMADFYWVVSRMSVEQTASSAMP